MSITKYHDWPDTTQCINMATQSEMLFSILIKVLKILMDDPFQVHAATQLYRDCGPHGGEPPARARLGEMVLGTEKGLSQ